MPKIKNLSTGSLEKYTSLINRLNTANLTAKEALSLSDSDLKKALNFHGVKASFEGLKRNIRNVSLSDSKDNIRDKQIIEFGSSKVQSKSFKVAKRNLAKVITGKNTFWFGVEKAKKLGYKDSVKATDTSIRKVKVFGYKKLNKRQKAIIDAISP